MKTEIEARLLDINEKEFINKLRLLNAEFVGDWFMTRNVYDFNPIDDNKWIRLRSDGEKTTLTIKIIENSGIEGTKELEIEVSDYEKTNEILNLLGYHSRSCQTNRRIRYILDDVEIDIDFWPKIPTYVEFEADSVEKIKNLCKKLNVNFNTLTTMSVPQVYLHYGFDVRSYTDAYLEEDKKNLKF